MTEPAFRVSDLSSRQLPGIAAFEAAMGLPHHSGAPCSTAPTLAIDPKNVEQDLARLALALMEFLRQLMEMQAIRRMEAGTLSAEQEEVLGSTLMQARARIISLAAEFGLSPQDLKIDLGPLGRLV